VGSARAKARDAKRLSEIKAIQTALVLYQSEKSKFPDSRGVTLILENEANEYAYLCAADAGFHTKKDDCGTNQLFLNPVPRDPSSRDPFFYKYTSTQDQQSYTITFSLETAAGQMKAGEHTATPAGIHLFRFTTL